MGVWISDPGETRAIALFGELLEKSSREATLVFSDSESRNAFTVPTVPPTVVVTRGLLRSLRSTPSAEAILRFILAHEIGHVPHVARLRIAPVRSLVLAGLSVPFLSLMVALTTWNLLVLVGGLVLGPVLIVVAADLGARVDRRRELAADRYAIEITGDHTALPLALQVLGDDGIYAMFGRRSRFERLFDSHPSDETRAAQALRVGNARRG